MLYPKKKSVLNKPNLKTTLSSKQLETRKLSLICKLSTALKLKHMPHFIAASYDEKELITDINTLLTPILIQATPNEMFNAVEKAIIAKVSLKAPRPSHKITMTESSSPKKVTAITPSSAIITNTQSPNLLTNNEDLSLYSTERHDLVDKLRLKREHAKSPNADIEPPSTSDLQKGLNEKKCKQQEEMFQYLKRQIEEKEKAKQRLNNEDRSFNNEQINQLNKWKNEKEAIVEKKLQMQNNFRESLAVISKERKDLEASIKAQKRSIESNILKANRSSIAMDKERMIDIKNKKKELYQQMVSERSIHEENKKQRKSDQLMIDNYYLAQFDEVMKKREKENEDIRQRIEKQFHAHDELEKKMTQIYSIGTPKKKVNDIEYIKEREAMMKIADDAKQLEKEKKVKMLGEIQKSLAECIKVKEEEKHMVKQSDIQYKEYLERNHLQYLTEEDKRKEIMKEKKRLYKEELDNQVVDKKKREIELMKQPIMPVKTTLTDNYREQY